MTARIAPPSATMSTMSDRARGGRQLDRQVHGNAELGMVLPIDR